MSDDLWSAIEPLLPKRPPRLKGGRPPCDDRKALTGIVFVLRTGIQWNDLPQELGCGSGVTCWRRLRDWQEAGVWDALHAVLLTWLHDAKRIDWSRACVDASLVPAKKGGKRPAPTPRTAGVRAASIT